MKSQCHTQKKAIYQLSFIKYFLGKTGLHFSIHSNASIFVVVLTAENLFTAWLTRMTFWNAPLSISIQKYYVAPFHGYPVCVMPTLRFNAYQLLRKEVAPDRWHDGYEIVQFL